jgi:ankyrin repeat protein
MLAARHGHEAIVADLIAAGAALDVTAKYGLSALKLAVVNGHAECALRIARAGAERTLRGSGAPGLAGKTAHDLALARALPELAAELAAEPAR